MCRFANVGLMVAFLFLVLIFFTAKNGYPSIRRSAFSRFSVIGPHITHHLICTLSYIAGMKRNTTLPVLFVLFLAACSPQQFISKQAKQSILTDAALTRAHVGISVYDIADNKYLYNYQGDHYFVPASNTKIVTCYAGMKYLGDSLPGIQYWQEKNNIYLLPTGDPSLLHQDFTRQPVIDFLKKTTAKVYITDATWKDEALGNGWSWNDYNDYYMAERSPLPVYGNVLHWIQEKNETADQDTSTGFDQSVLIYSIPEVNWNVRFTPEGGKKVFFVQRNYADNTFNITQGTEKKKDQEVPFVTNGLQSALELLPDTIGKKIAVVNKVPAAGTPLNTIHSQPTDSLFKPMMYRSDNFFAEQTLLMVSAAKLGVLSDRRIIDTLLKTDLLDLPQQPRWVDGSGLSRFNLFSPQDFVVILRKMQQEIGMDRIKKIFPTGGSGTLSNYYKQDSGFIYAKTGSLSGVLALSGYLYTKKNKLLAFSVLINNHQGNATAIRKQVETFITQIREQY